MNSDPITLDTRSGRVLVGLDAAFLVWVLCALRLNHRCLLGYKWFEYYSPVVIGLGGACCIVFVRKFWLGALMAAALGFAFFQFVIPPYLDWIHGPNHPYFPAAEARTRIRHDLRLIDTEMAMSTPTPEKPRPASK